MVIPHKFLASDHIHYTSIMLDTGYHSQISSHLLMWVLRHLNLTAFIMAQVQVVTFAILIQRLHWSQTCFIPSSRLNPEQRYENYLRIKVCQR